MKFAVVLVVLCVAWQAAHAQSDADKKGGDAKPAGEKPKPSGGTLPDGRGDATKGEGKGEAGKPAKSEEAKSKEDEDGRKAMGQCGDKFQEMATKVSEGNLEALLSMGDKELKKIPEPCLKRLVEMLKPGSCTVDIASATEMICKKKEFVPILKIVSSCLSKNDSCTLITAVAQANCVKSPERRGFLGSAYIRGRCWKYQMEMKQESGIMGDLLMASDRDFDFFMHQSAGIPYTQGFMSDEVMKYVPCEKRRILIKAHTDYMLFGLASQMDIKLAYPENDDFSAFMRKMMEANKAAAGGSKGESAPPTRRKRETDTDADLEKLKQMAAAFGASGGGSASASGQTGFDVEAVLKTIQLAMTAGVDITSMLKGQMEGIKTQLEMYGIKITDEELTKVTTEIFDALKKGEDIPASAINFLQGKFGKVGEMMDRMHEIPRFNMRMIKKLVEVYLADFKDSGLISLDEVPEGLRKLIPYLPGELCKAMPFDTVKTSIGILGKLDFDCRANSRPHDKDEDDSSEESKESKESKEKSGEKKDKKDSGESEEKEKKKSDEKKSAESKGSKEVDEDKDDLDHLKKYKCPALPQECGRALVATLQEGGGGTLSAEVFKLLGSLQSCMKTSDLLGDIKKLSKAQQTEICATLDTKGLPSAVRPHMTAVCMADKDFATMGAAEVEANACFLSGLSKKDLKKVKKDVLCAANTLDKIKECVGDDGGSAIDMLETLIADKCVPEEIGAADVLKIGKGVTRKGLKALKTLAKTDLENPEVLEAITAGLESMAKGGAAGVGAMARAIASKMDVETIAEDETLMSTLTIADLKAKSESGKADLKVFFGMDKGKKPKFSEAQKKWVIKQIVKPEEMETMAAAELAELGDVTEGFSTEDIDKLNSEAALEIGLELAKQDGWVGNQVDAVADKLREGLKAAVGEGEEKPMTAMDPLMAGQIEARIAVSFTDKEMEEASDEVCQNLCSKMKADRKLRCFKPSKARKRLLKVCAKCRGKDIDDDKADMNSTDVAALGQLFQEDADATMLVKKVPLELMPALAGKFRRVKCMKKAFLDKFLEKLGEALGDSLDEAELDAIGTMVLMLPKDTRSKSAVAIADRIDGLAAEIDPTGEDKDDEDCCLAEMSDADKQRAKEYGDRLQAALADVVRDKASQETTRRRRAVPSYTCGDIQSMGSAAVQLTVVEINAMTDTEFQTCVQFLGSIKDWSSEQFMALLEKAKTAVSPLCDMATADLQTMGTISYGFTSTDINCLKNIDETVIANLGSLSAWKQEQLEAFSAAYLKLKSNIEVSALTSDDLVSMGHFVCGLTSEQIAKIQAGEFKMSLAVVGKLERCAASRLDALALVAKKAEAYGPVKDWSPTTFNELGIFIAGLSGDDLMHADTTDLESFQSNGIKHIQPSRFKALSVGQLSSLSTEQAGHISSEQRAHMSVHQKNAVLKAQYGIDANLLSTTSGDGPGSDAAFNRPLTFFSLILATLVAFFL